MNLHGACSVYGNKINTYDDGDGTLWLYQDADGRRGVVRAQTEEDAYEIVLDEFLHPLETNEEILEAHGLYIRDNGLSNDAGYLCGFASHDAAVQFAFALLQTEEYQLQDGYAYQANPTGSGIVALSTSGESLELATPELLQAAGIVLFTEHDD